MNGKSLSQEKTLFIYPGGEVNKIDQTKEKLNGTISSLAEKDLTGCFSEVFVVLIPALLMILAHSEKNNKEKIIFQSFQVSNLKNSSLQRS